MYNKVNFPKSKEIGKRNWGKEILLALISKKISLKKLILKREQVEVCNITEKNECGIIISGKLKVFYVNNANKLRSKILKRRCISFSS